MSEALEHRWADLLTGLEVEIAAPVAVAGPGRVDHAAALSEAGFDAFLDDVGETPLTVVVNDAHRMTDTRAFLAALLARVDAASRRGASPILRMLVAAGTHKADALERSAHQERMAAPFLGRFAEIAWHDADDAASLARIGDTELHRWMTEGGSYVACGSVEPHYFAGVTGAHKTLTVGVMSRLGIERNHEGALSPHSGCLRLDGNPVHEGVVAALGVLEASGARLFSLNQVLVDGRVIAITAGHPLTALQHGLPLVRQCFARAVDKPFDLIVACVAPPLDRDLYQAEKGIKNTEQAVRDGGVILLDAACARGIGIDHFVELLRAAPSHQAALDIVSSRGYRLGDHKAVKLRALTDVRGVRVGLLTTHIDPAMEAVLGVRVFADASAAVAWALSLLPATRARAMIVEDAGNFALEVAARKGSTLS